MNTKVLLLSLAATAALLISGCAQKTETSMTSNAPAHLNLEFDGAPAWVMDPSVEGAICAVGSAKVGPAGMSFAITEATGNGRDDLARQIQTNVSNMLKNFTQQTGVGDQATVDKAVANVSKQLAKQDLSGSKATKKWISKTGTLWVLVVMQDPSKTIAAVKESVKTSYRNDEALWQQFQAKKAQDELDASLEKLDAK
ncbi:MAG: LPP20 family lipoprotein [Sulfuricurvum sp.]|nr:LPP20 family lipoprotein [Sulfuricurvum sp.]